MAIFVDYFLFSLGDEIAMDRLTNWLTRKPNGGKFKRGRLFNNRKQPLLDQPPPVLRFNNSPSNRRPSVKHPTL